MTRRPDPILDADLDAYVDDQLDVPRRIEVEAHLSARPQEAARIMSDLRARDELRLALAGEWTAGRPETVVAARRLERALARRLVASRLRRVASICLLVGAGWLAHAEIGPLGVREVSASVQPPAFVRDALEAHRTSLLRAGMASQAEAKRYDPAEILSATAIAMPALPADWAVADVQIFPSTFGPSVEIAVEAGRLGHISLFAVRPGSFDVVDASVSREGDITAAYWQVGAVGYALVASGADRDLLDGAARALSRTLY